MKLTLFSVWGLLVQPSSLAMLLYSIESIQVENVLLGEAPYAVRKPVRKMRRQLNRLFILLIRSRAEYKTD
jgi:hypothetical protein